MFGLESVSIHISPVCKDVPSGLCVGSLSDLITLGVFVVRLVTLVEAVEASVLIVSRVACKVLWVPLIVMFISVFKVLKPGSNFISSDNFAT